MDNDSVLSTGQATPFISIFDGNKKPIVDNKNGLLVGMLITSFVYEYHEEGGDKAEIVIETDNEDLLDQPELGDKMPLILQWGYVLPDGKFDLSPVRRVFIADTEWDGGEIGIKITLKCSDLIARLKSTPASRGDDSFEKWLESNLIDAPTKVVDYGLSGRLDIGNTSVKWGIDKNAPIKK